MLGRAFFEGFLWAVFEHDYVTMRWAAAFDMPDGS
jgi:hypothetical protein